LGALNGMFLSLACFHVESAVDPWTSFRVHPGCAEDTLPRDAAHPVLLSQSSHLEACGLAACYGFDRP